MSGRSSHRRGLAAWLGLLIGIAMLAYLGWVAVEGSRRIVRPQRRPFTPTDGEPATPADLGLAFEDVRFAAADGVTLSGWLMPAGRETTAAVILLHGYSWHRLPWLLAFVPWLQRRYHVLQFDFRGHGLSDDAPITLGTHEQRDVAAAVRFLGERGLGPIGLMGISMGGSVAIMAAPDLPVAAVIADAAYAELHHPIRNRMREIGFPLAELGSRLALAAANLRAGARLGSPIDRVALVAPRALLLISPEEDQLVGPTQARRLFDAAREPKELYAVPGAAHADAHAVGRDAYEARVLDFLERYLDPAPPV